MGERIQFERFLWFHRAIKAGRHPNAPKLAAAFELSLRTAERDIEFFRDRLGAPLVYSPAKKSYGYEDPSYELPELPLSEANVVALALAVRLASSLPDPAMKKELNALLSRILRSGGKPNHGLAAITELISIKNIEYSRPAGPHFQKIIQALFNHKALRINYSSPHSGQTTQREIQPLHLVLYLGNWHLIAFCAFKKELRDFLISRMTMVEPAQTKIKPTQPIPSVKTYIRKNFGIMQGGHTQIVKLKFTPSAAAWIEELIWHPKQKTQKTKNGGLLLQFSVADLREVKRRILSYGAAVEVLAPKGLRQEIHGEILKMKAVY